MNKFWILIILVGLLFVNTISPENQFLALKIRNGVKKPEILTFDQLQQQAEHKKNDTLYILNFWATWCKPCVEEMPFFEAASKKFSAEKVKVVYVSLNSAKEAANVQRFTEAHNIQNRVLLLNAPNPNDWIDKIDSSWSGAIPATVMYKQGEKIYFKEGGFTQDELHTTIITKNH